MDQHPRLHAIPGGRAGSPRPESARTRSEAARPRQAQRRQQSVTTQGQRPGSIDTARPDSARLRPAPAPAPDEPLWREVLGRRLRTLRTEQRETLVETAGRAGVSPQYLSEVERGRKDPSSEMIAALAGALRITLIGLTEQVVRDLHERRGTTFPAPRPGAGPTLLALAA
jgi:DNA-binding XRE family transcriptional regulator